MKDKKIVRKLFGYVWDVRYFYLAAIVLFSVQDFAFNGYIAFVQYSAVDFFEHAANDHILSFVIRVVSLYAVLNILLCIGMMLMDYLNITIGNKIKHDILENLLSKNVVEANEKMNELNQALINDSATISFFLTYTIASYLSPILTIIGFMIIVLRFNPLFTGIFLVLILIQFLYNLLVRNKVKKNEKDIIDLNSAYLIKIKDEIKMVSTIKLYSLFDMVLKNNQVTSLAIKRKKLFSVLVRNLRSLISNFFNIIVTIVILYYSITLYHNHTIRLSEISLLPFILGGIISAIDELFSISINMQEPLAAAKHMYDIANDEHKFCYSENLIMDTVEIINPENSENAIQVQHLNFFYADKQIFNDFNCNIKKGEIVRIEGEVGSGKSTLIKILMGFLKPKNGKIEVFGVDKSTVTEKIWLKSFAYMEQEPVLFNLSLKDNIMIADLCEEDDEKFNRIVHLCGIDKMAESLADGFDTIVGSRGVNLSGGQRQLISLARALYSEAPILILDEFSSSMDKKIEKKILNVLETIRNHRTILYISHRDSCKLIADRVINVR